MNHPDSERLDGMADPPTPMRRLMRQAGRIRNVPNVLAAHGVPVSAQGWRQAVNLHRLGRLRNRHRGGRGFVIGTGPSLTIEDLERLRGEVTIAPNRIYLAFEQTGWRPTYYAVVDEVVAENNREVIRGLDLTKFYSREVAPILMPDPRAVVVRTLPNPPGQGERPGVGFSANLKRGAHSGRSVTYLGLQIAAHLGLREVYLVGVDFAFSEGRRTGRHSPTSGEILISEGEQNHFHPDYRRPGEAWTAPDLERQREAFACARRYFESIGGRLVNASRRSRLEVLERADLEQVLGMPGGWAGGGDRG